MTLHQLKVFVTVGKLSSITKASQELHMSGPSVYQQVKSLQTNFGRNLYRRVGRGIELTADGRAFFTEASEVLRRAEELERQFTREPVLIEPESVVVGGSRVLSKSILVNLLLGFKSRHPNVQVDFKTESSSVIERLVTNDQIDLGLITNAPSTSELIIEPFRQEEMVVIASRKYFRQNNLTMEEFSRGPVIVRGREKSSSQQILENVRRQGFLLNVFMKCNSTEAIKVAVARGLGLGVLYRRHVDEEIKGGELKSVSVSGLQTHIQSFIVYKAKQTLLPAAREVLKLLRRSRDKTKNNKEIPAKSTTVLSAKENKVEGESVGDQK